MSGEKITKAPNANVKSKKLPVSVDVSFKKHKKKHHGHKHGGHHQP